MYTVNPRFYKHNETTKLVFYKLMVLIPYYNYIPILINHYLYSVNPYSIKVIHIILYYFISYLSKLTMYFSNSVSPRIKKHCIFRTYLFDKQVPYEIPILSFSQMLVISSAILSSPNLCISIDYNSSSSYLNIYVFILLYVIIIKCYIHKNKFFITAYIRIIMYSNMFFLNELMQFLDLNYNIIYINCKKLQIYKTICMVQFSRSNEHKELNAR